MELHCGSMAAIHGFEPLVYFPPSLFRRRRLESHTRRISGPNLCTPPPQFNPRLSHYESTILSSCEVASLKCFLHTSWLDQNWKNCLRFHRNRNRGWIGRHILQRSKCVSLSACLVDYQFDLLNRAAGVFLSFPPALYNSSNYPVMMVVPPLLSSSGRLDGKPFPK